MSTPISFRRAFSVALLPLALAACSDALAPAPDLDVALRISDMQGPFPASYPGSTQGALCDITFEAQGVGRGAHATWLDGTILFYADPKNARVPYDSAAISANDVRTTFTADTIGAGQVEHTRWLFFVPQPIGLEINFRYVVDPGGEVKTATTYLACGAVAASVATGHRPVLPVTVQPFRAPLIYIP